jgi:hypothetical protein
MNSSLPTKTVSFSQTKHLQWSFPMMLLTFCFVWFNHSACRNNGLRQRMFRENFGPAARYRQAVLAIRLGENIRKRLGSISDGSILSKAIALIRAMALCISLLY